MSCQFIKEDKDLFELEATYCFKNVPLHCIYTLLRLSGMWDDFEVAGASYFLCKVLSLLNSSCTTIRASHIPVVQDTV